MARNERTAEQFDAMAAELADVVAQLKQIAASMRETTIPHVLVHSTMPENTHIPAVVDWAGKMSVDVKSQLRSFTSEKQSRAELYKQQTAAAQQRAVGAKKATKKKP